MRPKSADIRVEWLPIRQRMELHLPKSQKAVQTRGSAPLSMLAIRARYIAQDDAGEPGRGSMLPVGDAVPGEAAHI